MARSDVEAQIQERTQEFLNEIVSLVRQSTISSLQEVLGGGTATLMAPTRRRRGRPAKGTSAPVADGALASKISSHVASSPGATAGQIANAVGSDSKAIAPTVKSMLAEGTIRKTGQRRGTRYFPGGPGRLPGTAVKAKKTRKARRKGRGKKA